MGVIFLPNGTFTRSGTASYESEFRTLPDHGKIRDVLRGACERTNRLKRGGTKGISFETDAEEGVIYSVAEGTLGLEDIQDNREKLPADPRFHPDLVEIVEYRLSGFRFSDEEVKALASLPYLRNFQEKMQKLLTGH